MQRISFFFYGVTIGAILTYFSGFISTIIVLVISTVKYFYDIKKYDKFNVWCEFISFNLAGLIGIKITECALHFFHL